MVKALEDVIGWKMCEHGVPDSKLTVLSRADDYITKTGKHQARYLCSCSCGSGKSVIASSSAIQRGKIKSCGCIRHIRKRNVYDLTGEYGIGYCTNTGNPFYFDLEDYDKIKEYSWLEVVYGKSEYHEVRTTVSTKPRKSLRLHQVICGITCDHIDRNPLNNRRNNLRLATVTENNRNRSLFRNNTSGVIGVTFEPRRDGWRARIHYEQKRYELGVFKEKEDAIKARLQAEAKYYKEFAPQRHLFKEYGILEDSLL